jgi:hypothetical protein
MCHFWVGWDWNRLAEEIRFFEVDGFYAAVSASRGGLNELPLSAKTDFYSEFPEAVIELVIRTVY